MASSSLANNETSAALLDSIPPTTVTGTNSAILSTVPIKLKLKKCLYEYAQLFAEIMEEITRSTKSIPESQDHLQYIESHKQQILSKMNEIIAKDKELQLLLFELLRHQKFQQKILALQSEVEDKDKQLTELILSLQKVHSQMLGTLHSVKGVIHSVKHNKAVQYDELIAYAHRISKVTSAPSGFKDGAHLKGHLPPHPLPELWGQSILYPRNLKLYIQQMKNQEFGKEMEGAQAGVAGKEQPTQDFGTTSFNPEMSTATDFFHTATLLPQPDQSDAKIKLPLLEDSDDDDEDEDD